MTRAILIFGSTSKPSHGADTRTRGRTQGRSALPLRRRPIAASLMALGILPGIAPLVGVTSLFALMAADMLWCSKAWAQPPRLPANALPTVPFTEYGTAIGYQVNGNKATITQTAPTNIVRWNSFDIGSAASVNIAQPSSTAVLLNKVDGGAYLNKTTIDGMLNANGRVYIYNSNGVIFGKTAQVNVDALMASSLKFDEARVIGGLLQPGSTPVLSADPGYTGGTPGAVQVEGDATGRATLTANNGGLILLAAPTVINNGLLNAPNGQVIVAAGSKVYLAAPNVGLTGTSLRGLLVEVSNDSPSGSGATTATVPTSTAENGESGQISVGQGNATMIGYAVNQNGIVSATTSVNLNGSIYLYARDQAVRPDANGSWQPSRTGKLVLGSNSVTAVLPTLGDTSTISATTAFNKSDVKLDGENIELRQNAAIIAPGGNVTLTARSLVNNAGATNPDGTPHILDPNTDIVRVDFAPGSVVDVSGSSGTQLAMESNVITVDLRGTELADNVVLRNSSLYGTKVQIDIRKGTSAANINGWLQLVQYNLGQMNAAGGTVNVNAEGAIIQRASSKINVDGGWVDYLAGYVNTTKLKFGDKLVDIGSAKPNILYAGAVNLPNGPASYEVGYRQGSNAGTVKFSAPILVLQGDLSGQVAVGIHQRDVAAADHPLGGELQIGDVTNGINPQTGKAKIAAQINPQNTSNLFVYTGNLQIGGNATKTAAAPTVNAPFDLGDAAQNLLATSLNLDPAALARDGFSRISALTSGNIDVAAPVHLAAGGHLWLGAGRSPLSSINAGGDIQFNAPITIPGGSVTAAASGTLLVADGVNFALAGLWTNDQVLASPALNGNGNPVTPLVLKGGALNLFANQLLVANNVCVDVSAGAWLDGRAKTTQGKAGSITLQADPLDPAGAPGDGWVKLGSGLNLSGYGFSSGGTLKLVGRNVSVGIPPASANISDLWLQPEFFQQGGFTSYDIAANVNFEVLANTVITPLASSWQLNPTFARLSSGTMATLATSHLFNLNGPLPTRSATSVTFRALPQLLDNAGHLVVNGGAKLLLDPGANLSLYAGRQLTVNGTLSAPAGHITLGLTATAGTVPFSANRSIWFGPNANLSAIGSLQRLYTNADGISSGEMLDGGTIQMGLMQNGVLSATNGYVVAESGSVFNVSGVGALGLRFKSYGAITPKQDVSSSGGSIEIRALEGLLFEGALKGYAGGTGASGGSLAIALDRDSLGPQGILTILPGSAGNIVPTGLQPGQAIVVDTPGTGKQNGQNFWLLTGSHLGANAKYVGAGWISTNSFSSGGFGRLNFKSQDALAFGLGQSDLTLSARDSLILDAPNLRAFNNAANNSTTTTSSISHILTLSAPYVQLGSADQNYQLPNASSTGNAQLYVDKYVTATLDLIGNSALQGFGIANLNAKADIRLVGLDTVDVNNSLTGYSQGSLAMTGNLTLTDAQTYPVTLNDFTFMVAANGTAITSGTLTFASNGNTPQQVLSAGGSLTGIASHIIQDGRVAAPFGSITLGNLDSTWSPGRVYGALFDASTLAAPDGRSQTIITADLKYKPGSVTSVAGSGVVPFGNVINGSVPVASVWQYGGTASISLVQGAASDGSVPRRPVPAKAIISHAQAIKTDSGSVHDLSGGGSLFAYEFTPGKGGSKDVLDNNTTFAINPNFPGSVAPIDSSYGSNGLKPGDSVYLSGMPGLPAGTYTLLPAHYALLPGGFSITVAANARDLQASGNTVLSDGAVLVAGRWVESGSGSGSTRSNGFIVSSGAVVKSKSEFAIFDAASYFTDQAKAAGISAPEIPLDGGYIAFDVSGTTASALALHGIINLGAATGRRRGTADISAPQIEIVADTTQGTGSAIKLVAGDLTAMGADSLLLGGLRELTPSPSGGGLGWGSNGSTHLTVGASNVTLSNDAQHPLSGPEVMIVANNKIILNAGATLQDHGTGHTSQDLTLDGSGALLRVSSGDQVSMTRTTASANAGTLIIASGATVTASGAAILDGSAGVTLTGQLIMAPGSALTLGAPGISLGSDIPGMLPITNLQLDTNDLAMFNGLSSLAFNSYASTIDLYGTVNLGNSAMHSLSFRGAGFQGYGSAADPTQREVSFSAETVSFVGTAASVIPAQTSTPNGRLAVQANTLEVGNNVFAIHGYADSTLTAQGEIKAVGTTGQLAADRNLTLAAGLINTASGAAASFIAGNTLTLNSITGTSITNPLTPLTAPGMGGQLNFTAANIVSNALIKAPSGKVVMSAANGIDISGGLITTAGQSRVFGSTTAYAPGGTIALSGGNVTVATPAVLDVSAVGTSAGKVSIVATKADGSGRVQLAGTLKGGTAAGIDGVVVPTQGQFALDTDQAGAPGQFGALNTQLNAAGFTESRQFRFRNGDVTLADVTPGTGDNITAHQVVISADNGNIMIAGSAMIDASGTTGGSIELYASQPTASGNSGKVTLADNTRLLAYATSVASSDASSKGNGGSVVIGTGSADGLTPTGVNGGSGINLLGGSIDVGGSSAVRNGTVTLRAPRIGTGNNVAVASLNTNILNSSATVVEAYRVYQGSTITEALDSAANLDATSNGRMYADANGFMANQTNILARLSAVGNTGATNLSLRPGIEVRSAADLGVSVNEFAAHAADRGWNLNAWRFGGAPIVLTLRAAGNLNIIGSISDGFVKPANTALAMPDWGLGTGTSASYRLAGGADLLAAHPLAVKAGNGDVYFGFAGRAPKQYVSLVDILNPTTEEVLGTASVPVPWRSTDGSLTSANVSAVALNAPITNSDAPVALVRTGTGSINVAAGRDITLGMARFFINDASSLRIDSTVFSTLQIKSKVLINGTVFSNPNINGAVFSDSIINGTPVIYDVANANGSYKVNLYGASAYTAGQETNLAAAFTAPQNALNSHYGASATTKSGAAFGTGGGVITVEAGGNVNGPQNLSSSWSYQNADYVAAVPFDPAFPDFPAEPAIPSTTVSLSAVVPAMVNNWLFRQGRSYVDANGNVVFEQLGSGTTLNTAWWSRYDYFNAGIATLGGGDIRIMAGGNVADLSVSVATSGYMPGTTATALVEQGGGDMRVRAGGDIRGGSFYVQKGEAMLRADGSVAAGDYVPNVSNSTAALNPVLALGDASINITAGRDVAIETAYNPTLTEQSVNNVNSAKKPGFPGLNPIYGVLSAGSPEWDVTNVTAAALGYREAYAQFSNFSTYGANSAVNLTAVGGDMWLSNDANTLAAAGGNDIQNHFLSLNGNVFPNLYVLVPAKVSAAALSGNLSSLNGFTLMPSSQGQLDLLATGSISLNNGMTGAIRMLDNNPDAMSNLYAPRLFDTTDVNVLSGSASGIAAHILGGLHSGDTMPVRLVAVTGDIVGDSSSNTLLLPKFAEIQAGRDIVDLGFSIQHNSAADVTMVMAGRDFIETTSAAVQQYDLADSMKNVVTGPGRIDINAGRNVDFGNRGGLVTRGNLDNPYLPEGGAAINMVAGGAQPDYAAFVSFVNQYGSANAVSPASQDMLDLRTFVGARNTGLSATATAENLWAAFRALSQQDQTLFLDAHPAVVARLAASAAQLATALAEADKPRMNAHFFSTLVEVSQQGNLGNFDHLIANLFPAAATATAGNIAVFASQIKTEQGGAINLFTPSGSVYAGLTTGISGKNPSTQGIFTIRGGAIAALVKTDFLVNQGRVFTLGGGDITLVSQYANIDAGKGAKTASSAPPPLITIDANGNIKVDVSGSIAGSGIATLKTHPDQPAGNVYAIAPRGIFDAGDAGVRSSGAVKITASVVLNGANISAAGSISGAPTTVAAPSLGSVAAPSGTTQNSDEIAKGLSTTNTANANALNVEVLGYGDDAGNADSPPDGACKNDTRKDGTCDDDGRKKKI